MALNAIRCQAGIIRALNWILRNGTRAGFVRTAHVVTVSAAGDLCTRCAIGKHCAVINHDWRFAYPTFVLILSAVELVYQWTLITVAVAMFLDDLIFVFLSAVCAAWYAQTSVFIGPEGTQIKG